MLGRHVVYFVSGNVARIHRDERANKHTTACLYLGFRRDSCRYSTLQCQQLCQPNCIYWLMSNFV
jgi:hypothetical protein